MILYVNQIAKSKASQVDCLHELQVHEADRESNKLERPRLQYSVKRNEDRMKELLNNCLDMKTNIPLLLR